MRTGIYASGALLLGILLVGCSSVSLPFWSKSAPVDPTAEALFEEGTRYFKEKRYVRAIDAFTRIKTEHPFSPLLVPAELKIADAYYLNEQYVEAVNAFKEFQALHPSSEHIPFIVLRLGQAHFNQFTNVNRDQKNTEIAKGYFEAVLANHPTSPYAAEAREKLAKCNGVLAEHDFNIAYFYYKQEKYPAARDRFEEIVRKYRGTPVASRSLFFLGESYRHEKNNVMASLAYEALLEHYPEDSLTASARTQLAQIEKDKQDPLAMLLMRDRRPLAVAEATETKETKTAARLRETNNLVAKTEVVYEAPGVEKGLFSRVVDKINPFSSSGDDRKRETEKEEKTKSAVELLAKYKNEPTRESNGFFASLWPFGGGAPNETRQTAGANENLVARIDDSLKQQGIDAKTETAALEAPAIDLPEVNDLQAKPQPIDNSKLLEQIDASLEKEGKSPAELPPPPEAAEAFKNPAVAQEAIARTKSRTDSDKSAVPAGFLSSIDDKLKRQGIEPDKFEPAPAITETESTPAKPKEINLESKRAAEKGPLFLSPAQAPAIEQSGSASTQTENNTKTESADEAEEPTVREIPKSVLVRGPQQPPAAAPAPKPVEQNKAASASDGETKGAFDQLKQDLENVGDLLNPFRW